MAWGRSSGGGGRRAWLTTKASQAAKWREVNKKLSETGPAKTGPPKVLARLDPTQGLRFPGSKRVAFAEPNAAYELRFGDHVCVVGPNGSGKSCWWQALSGRASLADDDEQQEEGGVHKASSGAQQTKAFMYMSFSMHGHFLAQHRDRVVADVLGGASDPLARRLIVTLGLYPLWYKKVGFLSTGEIRKVLLASVLSKSPQVLVLDKPFDGLDAPSRKSLKGVLSQLCQGFPRLLVDLGLSRRSIDRTSMVLVTHRADEIPDEVTRLVAVQDLGVELEGPMKGHRAEVRRRLIHTFPASMPPISLPKQYRPQVPRAETLRNDRTKESLQTLLEFSNVRLQKGDHVLLDEIDWKVKQGQVWALKGKNGAVRRVVFGGGVGWGGGIIWRQRSPSTVHTLISIHLVLHFRASPRSRGSSSRPGTHSRPRIKEEKPPLPPPTTTTSTKDGWPWACPAWASYRPKRTCTWRLCAATGPPRPSFCRA